jgi:hypothetical protein
MVEFRSTQEFELLQSLVALTRQQTTRQRTTRGFRICCSDSGSSSSLLVLTHILFIIRVDARFNAQGLDRLLD